MGIGKSLPLCRFALTVGAIVAVVAVMSLEARAAFVATLQQAGGSVVGNGAGTLNTTALTPTTDSDNAFIQPNLGILVLGPTSTIAMKAFLGVSGPTSFGPGGGTSATSGSGDMVLIAGHNWSLTSRPTSTARLSPTRRRGAVGRSPASA
jgi:hypothetical protein